ncbi:hypothetical protein CRUP_034576 [Coryphaenoides rupestris]|nr:hypothetical protein CRUP_034576 [Coryphaenoides rupestris]
MPGLQGDSVAVGTPPLLGSPVKKSKLSLKFFQKKETKRTLDFSEPPGAHEPRAAGPQGPIASGGEQVLVGPPPCPAALAAPGPLLPYEKAEVLLPFVGLNNLGNTCYLNSVLQVLYHCPGLTDGIKKLYSRSTSRETRLKEETLRREEEGDGVPAHMELLGSFNSLITSVEQLQSGFLLNPDGYTEGELATPPRKLLHTLRQLNPMYEGYLQHDAQEVLQCLLAYIQEACDTIRKEQRGRSQGGKEEAAEATPGGDEEDGHVNGKRKSDTEAGNAKKKPKSLKSAKPDGEETAAQKPQTRSTRRRSSGVVVAEGEVKKKEEEGGEGKAESVSKASEEEEGEAKAEGDAAKATPEGKRKTRRGRLSWLRPSSKQPSIFSKFRSMGKISSIVSPKSHDQEPGQEAGPKEDPTQVGKAAPGPATGDQDQKAVENQEGLDLLERLFQGRLVLRTRCLECESFTERREDFQDISVPVQEEQPSSPDDLSEVSPDPKPEQKTLRWAISQFASVERIAGEDKYFCEACLHYAEAERSLLFDKTPEVTTPLQTPLSLSLGEWCAGPAPPDDCHYQLFAVVMHSGASISSGHYTAYVRMSQLGDVRLHPRPNEEEEQEQDEEERGDRVKQQEQGEEEAAAAHYDDGEVSCGGGGRALHRGPVAGGKAEGPVGLLGGQRSVASGYDKMAADGAAEAPRRRPPVKKEAQGEEEEVGEGAERGASEQRALGSLLQYEGKWLLFDDSEVRLFEEEDFLRACSPDSCSTSTPYLLFYRRTPPGPLLG